MGEDKQEWSIQQDVERQTKRWIRSSNLIRGRRVGCGGTRAWLATSEKSNRYHACGATQLKMDDDLFNFKLKDTGKRAGGMEKT